MKKTFTYSFKTFFISLVFVVTIPVINFAQAPAIQWEKSIGGSGGDYVNSAREANNGGYVFTGTSNSNDGDCPLNYGNGDGMMFKLDVAGNLKWLKIFGGSALDQLPYVDKTTDGGYIALGYTASATIPSYHPGSNDVWVVKTDSAGNLQWQKCFGGSANDRGICSIHQMKDGNYLFCAQVSSTDGDLTGDSAMGPPGTYNAWVVKLDSGGAHNIIWQKLLGGSLGGTPKDAIETFDGGVVMVGSTSSTDGNAVGNHGSTDGWVVKLNSTGTTVVWEKCIGGANGDSFWSIMQVTADSSLAINGGSSSAIAQGNHGTSNSDYWFVNLSANGNTILWQRCFGGTGTESGLNAITTSDGKFIATGRAYGSNDGDITGVPVLCQGNYNFWQVKFDSAGVIWQNSLGGSSYDGGNMIIQTSDGGYLIGGESSSIDGDVTGLHGLSPYQEDAWIVKLASDHSTSVKNINANINAVKVFPNPSGNTIIIKAESELGLITIYNALGAIIHTEKINSLQRQIDISKFSAGIYFLQTRNNYIKLIKE